MITQPKKQLRITRCSDSLMWYANLVGQTVPYLGTWPEGYRSREPAGYINVVRFQDAEVIDVEDDSPTNPFPENPPERRTLQAAGEHPTPCARTCEANAFRIEIRGLKAERIDWMMARVRADEMLIDVRAERDVLAAKLKVLQEQVPVGIVDECDDGIFANLETPDGVIVKPGDRLYTGPIPALKLTNAAESVLASRDRQTLAYGRTSDHDDKYVNGELAAMACFYAMPPDRREWLTNDAFDTFTERLIPENWVFKYRDDRRRELVKAGALLLAEIERLDRAEERAKAAKGED